MKFYINSLPDQREFDDTDKCYSFVEFCISRYGAFWHTLTFDNPVSEKEAIDKIEEYLSQPMDDEYYNRIKRNLFPGMKREEFSIRRDALGDCIFIETIEVGMNDDQLGMKFWCGS